MVNRGTSLEDLLNDAKEKEIRRYRYETARRGAKRNIADALYSLDITSDECVKDYLLRAIKWLELSGKHKENDDGQ
jgi:hypothetical protein